MVPTMDTVIYSFFLENLCLNNINLLIAGISGVGKSNIILDFFKNLDTSKYNSKLVNFSA